MAKKIKTISGTLYNTKHKISSSPSSTICFALNVMAYHCIIFVEGEKRHKSTQIATLKDFKSPYKRL